MHISKFLVLALGASAVLAQDPNANPDQNSPAPAGDQPAPTPTDQPQPQPTDQPQPQPTDQNQPQPTDQNQPQPTDQNQPQPTDQNQPQPTDQNQPQPTDQNQPQPTDQNQQPQPTDQNQQPTDQNQQPQPTDQNQQPTDQNQQPQPTDQNQPQPTDQNQQPTDQNQPQPTDQNQPQPTDQNNQPQPTDQNAGGTVAAPAPSDTGAAPAPAPSDQGGNNNGTSNGGGNTLADLVTSNNKSLGINKFGELLQNEPSYKPFLDRLRSQDVTCFIPNNKAIDKITKSWKKYAKKNKLNETAPPPADWKIRGNTTITDVLNYHCIDGKQKLDDLNSNNVVVTTLDHSRPLRIESDGSYPNNQILPPRQPPAQPANNQTAGGNQTAAPPAQPADQGGNQQPADQGGNQQQNGTEQQQAQSIQFVNFQDQTANAGNGTANANSHADNEYKVGNGITDTSVTKKDIEGSNGFINVIEEPLMPPYRPTDTLDDLDQTVTFGKLLEKNPEVVKRLNTGQKWTLFAPNNDAFEDINTKKMDDQTINDLMNAHLVDGEHYIEAIVNDAHNNNGNTSLKAVNGSPIELFVNSTVRVNDTARVVDGNVLTNNGVIHVIDKILNRNDLRGRL